MRLIRGSSFEFIPAGHEDPQRPGVLKRVLATRDDFQAGHVQMLNWARLPAGSEFRRHYHEDMQEVFVLVTGRVQMTVAEQTMELQPGDAVLVEALEVHQMRNLGPNDADYLVFGISGQRNGQTVVVDP